LDEEAPPREGLLFSGATFALFDARYNAGFSGFRARIRELAHAIAPES
jgi:hypothetical protein